MYMLIAYVCMHVCMYGWMDGNKFMYLCTYVCMHAQIKKQLNSSNVIMENQRVEIVKLQRIIEEADAESTRQKNELSAVVS